MKDDASKKRVIRAIKAVRKIREGFSDSFSYDDELVNSETRTRYALIDPILKALGWNLHDPAQVKFEFATANGRTDYAMFDGTTPFKPSMILEAKKPRGAGTALR